MKLELDVSDEMWKRIEERASLFHVPPAEFIRQLLEQHVPHVHDRAATISLLEEFAATKDVAPEDDYDIDEFLEALERNRGGGRVAPERNGEAAP